MLWVCSRFFSLQLYFGCPSEPEEGIKVLGKCPDNLQVGQALLRFSSCQGEVAGSSSPLSDEEAEDLGSFKVHITGHSPKWGAVNCVLTLSCQMLQIDPFSKMCAISPCMPNASDNHTRTANTLQRFISVTTIPHFSVAIQHTL